MYTSITSLNIPEMEQMHCDNQLAMEDGAQCVSYTLWPATKADSDVAEVDKRECFGSLPALHRRDIVSESRLDALCLQQPEM